MREFDIVTQEAEGIMDPELKKLESKSNYELSSSESPPPMKKGEKKEREA